MLQIKGVSKSYGRHGKRAVDNLDLHAARGEIFGFLGPNGAGKTTTIKMVVGLLRPDSGTITVNGIDVVKDPVGAKRQIGYVPDSSALYERLTGIEYLQLVADIRRVPAGVRKRRVEELAEMFQLARALPDLIQSYSHGMKQKLQVIAALIADPPLLILDEPMVGLDPRSNHLFKELMRKHCSAGNTVFFSTHILEVAERLCDRIGIIKQGRLVAVGGMDELRSAGRRDASLESIFLELTESGAETNAGAGAGSGDGA